MSKLPFGDQQEVEAPRGFSSFTHLVLVGVIVAIVSPLATPQVGHSLDSHNTPSGYENQYILLVGHSRSGGYHPSLLE